MDSKTLRCIESYAYAALVKWKLPHQYADDLVAETYVAACKAYHDFDPSRSKMDRQHFVRLRASYGAKEAAEKEFNRLRRVGYVGLALDKE